MLVYHWAITGLLKNPLKKKNQHFQKHLKNLLENECEVALSFALLTIALTFNSSEI